MNSAQRPAAGGRMSVAAPVPEPKPQFHLPSYLLGLATALVLLGTAFFVLRRPEPTAMRLQPPPAVPSPVPTGTPISPTPSPLVIFVSGAVLHPGLYTLPEGSRIGDAIAAAGGLLLHPAPRAHRARWLARLLKEHRRQQHRAVRPPPARPDDARRPSQRHFAGQTMCVRQVGANGHRPKSPASRSAPT